MSNVNSARVAILLGTYNGEKYLAEQLDSFAAQSYTNWQLFVSDDGSTDDTMAILSKYQEKWGQDRLKIKYGPARGFVANFLSLSCNPAIQADYYAFSDQDDVWGSRKIERAVKWLETIPSQVPALYASRTLLVDADNNEIGLSPLFTRAPSFSNALVQNVGGANTMVFNDAARQLVCEAGWDMDLISHDWWVYLVVSGCGGHVFHDTHPETRYRQHGQNLVGSNISLAAIHRRLQLLLEGNFHEWNEQNIEALQKIRSRLMPENRIILDEFAQARHAWLLPRLMGFKRCKIYRQTLLGNIGLIVATLLKKI